MRWLKRILKWFSALLGLALVAVLLFAAHTWFFKPVSIDLFFAKTALKFALESPQMLTSLHIFENFGIDGHNAKLDDDSIEAGDRMWAAVEQARDTLISYDNLDEANQLSKDISLSLMNIAVRGKEFRFHNYPLNQMFGAQSNFPSFMESTHQVHDEEDAEHYLTRLTLIDKQFQQVLEGLHHREKLNILPPQFVVTKVLEEMEKFVATPAEENILVTALVTKMEDAEFEQQQREEFAQRAGKLVVSDVYPAYGRFIEYFKQLDDKVSENHGVWALPDGDRLYKLAIEFFTTTDYTADFIHNMGLSEVYRIQSEIMNILEGQGWESGMNFKTAIDQLTADERFYYSDTDEGRQQILDDYQQIIDEISTKLDPWFEVKPSSAVEVKRVPEFKEKTAPGAYYNGPAMDGSRPGVFYANLYDIKATPKYGMRTLAYHEAVPGHHFQIAIQQETEGLPFFRRLIPFTAFAEGWALYSEHVAWEAGLQSDPFDNVGRLQAELFRAVRLVVDTGIHDKRWNREQAIEYMLENTGMAESDVVSEIERYFVMPGQALAYKVGMNKIMELRTRAETELGDNFDIRDFHNVVLTNGSLPLTILERLVNQYIADNKS